MKGTRNKKTVVWKVSLEIKQSEAVMNKILAQTSKPGQAQYRHVVLFSPKAASLLKTIKRGFPKTWTGLIETLFKKHLKKSSNTTMVHLKMRRQGIQ